MGNKIWLSSPHLGDKEREYVNEAFDTNWIAPVGPHLRHFEEALASYCKVGSAAALSSGTAAIHLGLKLLGVEHGDYVLCQSFTFCGSANPILYLGATPVFIDSEAETWNMDPELVEQAILKLPKRPKCIIPVHLYGMPAQMDKINEIAEKYGVPVLEDAAEALGSSYLEKPCGSMGDLSVLSFNGNKIITTSGGGALLGNNKSLVEKATFLATQARESAPHYQHSEMGFNYRLSNVSAAIGMGQMEVIDQRVSKRRAIFESYKKYFEGLNQKGYRIRFQPELKHSYSNRWLSCILIDPGLNNGTTRETIRLALEKENIESRPLWKPMHLQPLYSEYDFWDTSVSVRLFEQGLCLPSGSNISDEQFDRIFTVLDRIFHY